MRSGVSVKVASMHAAQGKAHHGSWPCGACDLALGAGLGGGHGGGLLGEDDEGRAVKGPLVIGPVAQGTHGLHGSKGAELLGERRAALLLGWGGG